jgi:stress-induced-phosphoprotein 1
VLAEELRKEGVRLVKAGQAAAAEIVYTEAIKYAPRTHMLYSNRAACYARLGRHADALADARACIALAPQACRGHWQEALALEAQGRYPEALVAYERACRVARETDADPSIQREYEARRESLRRTTASQQDAADRVARILAEAERAKAAPQQRGGLFSRAPRP